MSRLLDSLPTWARGLRARLVFAFLAVAALGAAAAAGASYVSARTTVLKYAQDQVMVTTKETVSRFAPELSFPPTQATLDQLVSKLPDSAAVVTYQDLRSRPMGYRLEDFPAELRTAVRTRGTLVFQRGLSPGGSSPMFYVGMPVLTKRAGGELEPSGMEVYLARNLGGPAGQISDLAQSAWQTSLLALPLAALLALLAARGVLRPVRELRGATRRLASGELGARLEVKGSDELADLAHTFNDTAAALDRTVTGLQRMEADARRFVADVSHELRTPLAAMTAVTDVLDEEAENLPEDAQIAARLVGQETRKLARMVEDLIEISRFDAGAARLVLTEVDVAEAVRNTLRARGWTDQVTTELPEGVRVKLDARRLDVIVANLVGNALRHGEPPVVATLTASPQWIELTVTDHGSGLPEAVLPQVFARFYKADSARSRSEGSGLGLAIAWENAQLHYGTIEAANAPHGGARFTLRLPRLARGVEEGGPR
ncbi:HAMP domain-containing histidine kinase [Crossiella sp. SN42]|uniref:sensor histidine kinase n=1 Tax=Crossiella sp. SN42 TaxID=2944808 RepID=UPI00207C37AC|nr:HAMP domain-containing sensor histidine kinase [Crossiella sp. SN42]MCO1579368.1 HAMP domain-containing histidine kinase [Crossiella sp. SN42]